MLRKDGIKAGLFRPKTLFPFPEERCRELGSIAKAVVVAELNNGQMAEDVELAMDCPHDVVRCNWFGGIVPSDREVATRIAEAYNG
mgnify:CR=1 FL=1